MASISEFKLYLANSAAESRECSCRLRLEAIFLISGRLKTDIQMRPVACINCEGSIQMNIQEPKPCNAVAINPQDYYA